MSEKWKHVVIKNFTKDLSKKDCLNLFDSTIDKSMNGLLIAPNENDEGWKYPLGVESSIEEVTNNEVIIKGDIELFPTNYNDGTCTINVKKNKFYLYYYAFFEVVESKAEYLKKYLMDTFGVESTIEDQKEVKW